MKRKRQAAALFFALLTFARARGAGAQSPPPAPAPDAAAPDASPSGPPSDAAPPPPPAAPSPDAAAPAGPAPAPAPDAAPPPPPAAEDVVVAGTRPEQAPGSAHVIKDKELQRFKYDDPHQVLTAVPGVYVRGEDGFGLRPNIGIRGAASDRSKKLTLMEDGVLFGPAPYSAPAAYYFPLVDRMTAVRIVKGPGSIVYGPSTVGGAVDLVTRAIPTQRTLLLDLAAGQYGYNREHLVFGHGTEDFGFLVEGVRLANSGFKELDGVGGDTGFVRNEWMVKGHYGFESALGRHDLGLKLGYSDEDSNETYLGLTDGDFERTPYRRYASSKLDHMTWTRTQVALTHTLRLLPELEVASTLYRNQIHRVWRKVNGFRDRAVEDVLSDPGSARNAPYYGVLTGQVDSSRPGEAIMIGPNDRDFEAYGAQTTVRYSARTGPIRHKIETSIRGHFDRAVRRHSQDAFRTVGGRIVAEGGPTEVTAQNEANTTALSVYLTDAATWDRLTVMPGVRVEAIRAAYRDELAKRSDGGSYQVVLPGVGAYYALTRELGLLGGVYRGFSPAPPEAVRQAGPEDSVNYEGGVRWSSGKTFGGAFKSLRAEAIGFLNDYYNLTSICTFSSGCTAAALDRQYEAGGARVLGLELFAIAEPRLGPSLTAPIRAAYTYTRTEFLNDFTSGDPTWGAVKAGDEFPYVPRHQATGSVGVEGQRWGAYLATTFVDAMREVAGSGDPPAGKSTDAYLLFDLSAKYKLTRWLEIYGNGRNLLDTAYVTSHRPYGARPGAPRWVSFGLRAEFH